MAPVTDRSFGILIAYLIPGFLVIWGFGQDSPFLSQWLALDRQVAPTVGGFLYVTIASLATGLGLSTIRWAIIDQIHHRTGLPTPAWDFRRLQENVAAYRTAVDFHYRYYQFYANCVMAMQIVLLAALVGYVQLNVVLVFTIVAISALFFIASRDALAKYYRRTQALIPNPNPNSLRSKSDDQWRRSA